MPETSSHLATNAERKASETAVQKPGATEAVNTSTQASADAHAAQRELLVLVPFRKHHMDQIRAAAAGRMEIRHLSAGDGTDITHAVATATAIIGEPEVEDLAASPTVQWVQMTWAGTDKYTRSGKPFPAGIQLTSAVGGYGHTISQFALGQALSICQNLGRYAKQQVSEQWRDLGAVESLEGATVLIFGAGDIGGHCAKRFAGFDAHIIGVCRNTRKPRAHFDELCTLDQAETFIPRADVIIGAIPNNDSTAGYFDARRLALCKPSAALVNVGRGNFIDNMALDAALRAGQLRGAALDVTDPEPLPAGHPLWQQERCLITPHCSGGAFGRLPETEQRICDLTCDNIRRFLAGKPLRNRVL